MLKAQFFIRKTVLYVRFSGELDQRSIEKVRVRVSELITNYKIEYLVINCRELTFMDSSGIGFIIGRYNQLKLIDGKIFICEMNDLITRIVNISGLSRIVNLTKTEEEANYLVEGMYEKIHKLRV
ncbi:MAG: anti-sigma factor antagonist [Coprobacillus sp.]|nr:anti-sigma factor antagonist [Coprobacillus sp.]MDY4145825.1 anti-sigma factor antagonist [Bacilli bacterium]OLA07576.1 MAG: hypothetical protein BHW12_06035 [Coprobacillus sp. 28_7]CCY08011.1 anti-sigma F factor antagonist [Coprobacillus sp. CAG:698]